jgi:hypothetical protein
VREKILLVGNSANHNRGCEAIARGTLATFNEITGGEAALSSGVIVHSDVAERYVTSHPQHPDEPEQFALRPRLADDIGSRALAFGLGRRRRYRFGGLDRQLAGATRMLEVGATITHSTTAGRICSSISTGRSRRPDVLSPSGGHPSDRSRTIPVSRRR